MKGGTVIHTAVRAVKKMPEYMECKIIEKDENRCEYLNDILDDNHMMKRQRQEKKSADLPKPRRSSSAVYSRLRSVLCLSGAVFIMPKKVMF